MNSTRTVCAMANSASVIVRHAQQSSDDAAQLAHGINFAGRDSKINTSWQTAFLPDTREQLQVTSYSYKFLAYYVDFDLKKKIVLLIVLLFLASMLTKLSSTDIIAVTLATALLVSTSLLATLENLERVMAAARSLLLIIILILNTTACVAVVEMVRFFSVEKHFLLTVTVP